MHETVEREWTPAMLLSAKQQDSNLPGREAEPLSRKAEQRPGGIRRQGKAGEMPKCGHWEPVKRPCARSPGPKLRVIPETVGNLEPNATGAVLISQVPTAPVCLQSKDSLLQLFHCPCRYCVANAEPEAQANTGS